MKQISFKTQINSTIEDAIEKISKEFAKPTLLIDMLEDPKLSAMALEADIKLKRVIDNI